MATWTIKPKKGTTAQWQQSGKILEVNEWGVEETASGHYILRIGDGQHEFLDLSPVVDTDDMTRLHAEISNYVANMQQAAAAANTAAGAANSAATAAQAGAKACEKMEHGINSMSDQATGKVYTIGVEAGKVYLQEVES